MAAMGKQDDLRYVKAEEALKEAFWQLMAEEGFDAIAVKQILARAGVSRSTFYNHYPDKYALLDAVEDDLVQDFLDLAGHAPKDLPDRHDAGYVRSHCGELIRFVVGNADRFAALLGEDGDPRFLDKLVTADRKVWEEHGLTQHAAIPQQFAASGVAGMVASLIAEWAKSGYALPADDFEKIMQSMLVALVSNEALYD